MLFRLSELAATFDTSPDEIRAKLYYAGFDPAEYGADDRDHDAYEIGAMKHLAEQHARAEENSSEDLRRELLRGAAAPRRAHIATRPPSVRTCQLPSYPVELQ